MSEQAPSRPEGLDPPVTVIRELRVKAGKEAAFEAGMSRVIAGATAREGYLGANVVRPAVRGQAYRFIYKFAKRSQLEAWHASRERAELVGPLAEFIELDRFNAYATLETWFELPVAGVTPPKWKTTLMTWAAIYVLVTAVSYVLHAVKFEAPLAVRTLVLTGVVVPIVAYVVGPWLGKRLHGWLHAGLRVEQLAPEVRAPGGSGEGIRGSGRV